MSIHKSLNLGGGISTQRSVWTRRERIEKLLEDGRFGDGDRPTGLPKVRTNYKVLTRKQLKAREAELIAEAGGTVEGAEGEGEAAASSDEA
jgi:small basic protein (TIGR04137 family)